MEKYRSIRCIRMPYRFGSWYITLGLIGASLLMGQTEEQQEIESDYVLPEIVVTATKTNQTLQQVPLSTTLVSREIIESIPATDVADVLQFQTGTTVRRNNQGGMSTISLRGTTAAQVLVTRDGIPINDPFNGTVDLSQLGLSNIEKIEIVRGPTSHLYGANALGGVVNLITREIETTRDIAVSYGSYNTQSVALHGGKGNREAGVHFSADMDRSDGWRGNDDYLHRRVTGTAAASIVGVNVALTTGYSDSDVGVPGPKPSGVAAFGNEEVSSLFNRQTGNNLFGLLTMETKPWKNATIQLRARPERNTTVFQEESENYLSSTLEPVYAEYQYHAQNLRVNGQLETLIRSHRFLAGFELANESGTVEQGTGAMANPGIDTTVYEPRTESKAVWMELIGEKDPLSIVGGLRLDLHSVYGQHVSPCIGIIHRTNRTALKISLGKAYRAPSHNDLFWPIYGNPDLKPESGLAKEISYEVQVLPAIWGKCSLFRREVRDMIAWIPSDLTGMWQPQNINRFDLDGMEWELAVRTSNWHVSLAYTYLQAEQVNREQTYSDWMTGEFELADVRRPAAFVPTHALTHQLSWVGEGFKISLNANWRSDIYNTYEDWLQAPTISRVLKKLPDRLLVNGKVVFNIGKMRPYLAVRNLWDEKYSDQFGTDFYDLNYPMPGRTVEVGMRLKL